MGRTSDVPQNEILPAYSAGGPEPNPTWNPCRVDIRVEGDGTGTVTKYWKVEQSSGSVKEIALFGSAPLNNGYDPDKAIDWLKANGYTVHEYPLDADAKSVRRGIRAWKGEKPWPIRTASQVRRKRDSVEKKVNFFLRNHPGASTSNLLGLDFAFDY